MRKIVLISCVSRKRTCRCRARDLYISPLFQKNMAYAMKQKPDAIYILSAEHGLLALDTVIEPYNTTLNEMGAAEIRGWSERVAGQLAGVADLQNDHFTFLAGTKYRKFLLPRLKSYEVPMEGLSIGRQLQFLSR